MIFPGAGRQLEDVDLIYTASGAIIMKGSQEGAFKELDMDFRAEISCLIRLEQQPEVKLGTGKNRG